jgi:hypothetical protein
LTRLASGVGIFYRCIQNGKATKMDSKDPDEFLILRETYYLYKEPAPPLDPGPDPAEVVAVVVMAAALFAAVWVIWQVAKWLDHMWHLLLVLLGLAACAVVPMQSQPPPWQPQTSGASSSWIVPAPAPTPPAPVPTPQPYQHVSNDPGAAQTPPAPAPRHWIDVDPCDQEWHRVACLLPGVPF